MHCVIKNLSLWLSAHVIPQQKLIVAYSGGRDSHVLLDALTRLQNNFAYQLSAIHVNHGLQVDAQKWAAHCQKWCDDYKVSLKILNLSFTVQKGQSLEEQARLNRYQALSEYVLENDLLVTAHSQDDQAETFVLQLMRGSGVKGLAGISPLSCFAKGFLARPLLNVSRHEIADYANKNKLSWIEDPSNQNINLRRNFIRHHILQPFEKVQQNVSACIARSAKHCGSALHLLDEYLVQDLAHCLGENPSILKVSALQAFSALKQIYLFRFWLSKNQVKLPNERKCQDMLRQFLSAKEDASPQISIGNHQLRRYQQFIYILPLQPPINPQATQWDLKKPITLADGGIWQAKYVKGRGLCQSKLHNHPVTVKYRHQYASKSLKKLLQTHKIAPWHRQSLPLFFVGGSLIGVGTVYLSKAWQVQNPEEEGICFEKVIS